MEHDLEARRRLGRAVRSARRAAGLSKTAEWAERVGRSDRMLLGLERGEAVGPDTYRAVATALGWPLEQLYAVLDGSESPVVAPPSLAAVSDEELAAEVLRRMKSGGAENAERSATTKDAGSGRRIDLAYAPVEGPYDADLDALPDEREERGPLTGGRQLPDAARRTDRS